MFASRFRLLASQRADLARVCRIGSVKLRHVADKLINTKLTIRRSAIEQLMRETIGDDDGEVLGRFVFGIAGAFRRTKSNASEFLRRLDVPTQSDGDIVIDERVWSECRPALQALLEADSILLAAKALDVSYDFERVFLDGRLVTSIRPIFDGGRAEIVGSTIVQTLRIEFIAPNGDQSNISVALDADDIAQLRDECERALTKAAAAKMKMEKDAKLETIIPGEEIR